MTCTKNAPSQPIGSPIPPPTPSYPFQYVVMDYLLLAGHNYLIIGDRFSGWLSIYETGQGQFDGKTLVKKMREWYEHFNIPEEVASDGGPQMMSTIFQESLKAWDVKHRLSSSYYAHSNCRAELAVKTGNLMVALIMTNSWGLLCNFVIRRCKIAAGHQLKLCMAGDSGIIFQLFITSWSLWKTGL